eukprot:TRINITY_DN597_c0_g1_i1.p2 TRINITY_DN597_c0_g1~~TRINITY_DN597_c0_g1_i1.p2  ORF type:complete len:111 (-),score=7.50 TRINITY_DN597_c0_g1_i1:36-368(-)
MQSTCLLICSSVKGGKKEKVSNILLLNGYQTIISLFLFPNVVTKLLLFAILLGATAGFVHSLLKTTVLFIIIADMLEVEDLYLANQDQINQLNLDQKVPLSLVMLGCRIW